MSDERWKMSREAFAARFFPGSRRIAPGIWIDGDGNPHWSILELLEMVDLEDTPANRAQVAETIEKQLRGAGLTIVRIDPEDET